jgi:hypothetical protein
VHIRHKLKITLYMMINRIHTRVFNLQFLAVVYPTIKERVFFEGISLYSNRLI